MNERLPVYQLPEELILEILNFVRLSLFPSHKWILVTHVSRRWRAIALASPAFWSLIGAYPPSIVFACIERAKDVPLTLIYYESSRRSLYRTLDWVNPHAQRLITVKLALHSEGFFKLEDSKFYRQSWDSLEVLSLRTIDKKEFTRGELDSLFAASPPLKLRSLELVRIVTRPWRSLCSLQNLRVLILRDLNPEGDGYGPSMDEFLDVLEGCSLLEELDFEAALPSAISPFDNTYPEPRRHIELKNLRKVVLSDEEEIDTAFFLAHLYLPKTSQLHIICPEPSSDTLPKSVISCLPRDLGNLKMMDTVNQVHVSSTYTSTTDEGHDKTWLVLNINASYRSESDEEGMRIRLTQGLKGGDIEGLVRSLFRSLKSVFAAYPGVQLVIFSFGCLAVELYGITEDDWFQALSAFPSASYLCFNMFPGMQASEGDVQPLKTLLRALGLNHHPSSSQTEDSPAMSLLEGFAFINIDSNLAGAIQEDALRCARYRTAISPDPDSFRFLINDEKI